MSLSSTSNRSASEEGWAWKTLKEHCTHRACNIEKAHYSANHDYCQQGFVPRGSAGIHALRGFRRVAGQRASGSLPSTSCSPKCWDPVVSQRIMPALYYVAASCIANLFGRQVLPDYQVLTGSSFGRQIQKKNFLYFEILPQKLSIALFRWSAT